MLQIGQKVNLFTQDKAFIIDSGEITKITPESEEAYAIFEITLDDGKVVQITGKEIDRIQTIEEEETESLIDWIKNIFENRKKIAVYAAIILAVIGGSILLVKQHHATPKVVQIIKEKTQIEKWTDEMATLEIEKAGHYERQKYLRTENRTEVEAVKKIDTKINKLRDKIHLYITPSEYE